MKVEVKKIDTIKRELKFEIPKDRVAQVLEDVYKDIGKAAKVKGFRPGKVPRHILESQHGKSAQSEMIQRLIPEAYHAAINKENLQPVEMPEILYVNVKDGILTFKAKVDTKPEVKIDGYKGVKVTRKANEVTDEDINKTLDYFKAATQGKEKETIIDDAFARGLGYPTLEEFNKVLRQQLAMDKDRQNRMDVENQVVEQLLKKAKVTAPESLVKKQMDHRIEEM